MLITSDRIVVKRMRKDEDNEYVILENDNETYGEPKKWKKQKIKKLMMIRGKISKALETANNVNGDGKINHLEASVDLLKKELSEMNKKLGSMTTKKN